VTDTSFAERVRAGDRRALAQAISLVESTRADHRIEAETLLTELMPHTGGSHRVAFTGAPGAGKSSLVDALGGAALAAGQRVAVLAIDPASAITSGSLLGDAVRMQRLAASEQVFVRASSNAGSLGGIAPATREAILLCEAAGFRLVLIETVGVGQAEHAVRDLCDTLLLLALAGAGDEVQGIKRGVLEVVDAVLVNKADGAGEAPARAFASELAAALGLLRRGQAPWVTPVSAQSGLGVPELFDWLVARFEGLRKSGELTTLRQAQLEHALSSALSRELLARLRSDPRAAERLGQLRAAVGSGQLLPTTAARQVVEQVFGR
jgi:LAO/AO transport system kinase